MGRKRIYANNAQKQAAYRARNGATAMGSRGEAGLRLHRLTVELIESCRARGDEQLARRYESMTKVRRR